MPKLKELKSQDGHEVVYVFFCPGCKSRHPLRVKGDGPKWNFDGNMEAPTFSPSLLVNKDFPDSRCHLFLRSGVLEFLSDCHHDLKGQKVPLPEIED